jgi:hypothetical protein
VGVGDGLLRCGSGCGDCGKQNGEKHPRSHIAGSQGTTTEPSVHTWIRHEIGYGDVSKNTQVGTEIRATGQPMTIARLRTNVKPVN